MVTKQSLGRGATALCALVIFAFFIGIPDSRIKQRYEAPVTSLPLRLIAVNTGSVPVAIIEDLKTKQQSVFEIHDQVQGAEIIGIEPEYVLFQIEDHLELLPIKVGFLATEKKKSMNPFGVEEDGNFNAPPEIVNAGEEVVRADLSLIEQQWKDLPSQLFQAGVSPTVRDGQIVGLTISAVPEKSILEAVGLKSGDMVRSINGVQVNDPLQVLTYLDSGQIDPANVQIQVERGGAAQTLRLSLGNGS